MPPFERGAVTALLLFGSIAIVMIAIGGQVEFAFFGLTGPLAAGLWGLIFAYIGGWISLLIHNLWRGLKALGKSIQTFIRKLF